MKFRYFLRGLGVGIIFASIVCLVAINTNMPKELSDDEIIERAKELGLTDKRNMDELISKNDITTEDLTVATTKATSEEDETTAEATTKATTEATTKATTEATTEATTKATTEATTEATTKATTEATTKATTEATTEKTTESTPKLKDGQTYKLVVKGGDFSYPISIKLRDAGMIDNAEDFDTYLVKNGYANRISVGTHKLKKGMTYKQIAEAISDPVN